MARFIWARDIAGGCIKWIRRERARWCGPRISPRFSPSRWTAKAWCMPRRRPTARCIASKTARRPNILRPRARYIWALKVAPDGALFVATGDQGKIFRVTAAGHGEVYYETGQSHVTCLAFDREGRLLAGSEPNGILVSHQRRRIRRSCCTTRTCRRFARLCRPRMAPFTRRRWAAASRGESARLRTRPTVQPARRRRTRHEHHGH